MKYKYTVDTIRQNVTKALVRFNSMKKVSKIEWGILGAIILLCYVTFNQGDLFITALHGKTLVECILHGEFFEFYDHTESTAIYLIPIYIFFAIWSVPVFIICSIFNIPINSGLDYNFLNNCVWMWYKLLPTIFCILSGIVLLKIGEYAGIEKGKRNIMLFSFFSFPILIFSQFIFGQYDSIGMFFTLLAFYYYLQKKYYKFAVLFSVAITFKLFALFLFIPLVLLVEKRIVHIVKYGLIGISAFLISNVLFLGSKGFADANSFTNDNFFGRLFVSGITTSFGTASYFCIVFAAVCVFAYLKTIDEKSKEEYCQWATYICLVIYSSLFMFILWHPQWVILLVPFLVLSDFMNQNLKVSILLNIALSIGYLLIDFYAYSTSVDEVLINTGIMPMLFGWKLEKGGMLSAYFGKFSLLDNNMYVTIFLGSLLINLILKYPTKRRIIGNTKEMALENTVERGYYYVQLFTIFLYLVPTFYLFFIYYR